MDLHLKDKVIIVTGGAKGIGRGIAECLAIEGACPVIVGRNLQDNLEVVAAIESMGGNAFQVVAELTNPQQCADAVQQVADKYGRIEGLVNNAGLNDGVSLESGDYERFIASLHKNLIHYFLMTHHALPWLKQSKGAIVNISSKTAETGQGNTSGYAASNGGRNALTREWAVELLKYEIRVNALVVAECFTPQYAKWVASEEKLKAITKNIPFQQRMTTVEEIADMVVFLLSERSSHTTGQILHVDGGYVHLDRAL